MAPFLSHFFGRFKLGEVWQSKSSAVRAVNVPMASLGIPVITPVLSSIVILPGL